MIEWASYAYDVMGRLESIVWRGASNQVLRRFDYGYNSVGMITNVVRESGESTAYAYDSLDRLVEERKILAGGQIVSRFLLGYDRVGNRTNKTVYSGESNLVARVDYVRGSGNRLASWSVAGTNLLGLVDVAGVASETIGTNDAFGQSWVSNRFAVRPGVAGSNFWAHDFAVGVGTQQVVAAICDRAGNPGYATNVVVMAVVTNGAYQYSAAGCVTNIRYAGAGYSNAIGLAWDGLYQLTEARSGTNAVERYGYDAKGRLLWRWDGSETNWMIYDGIHVVAEVSGFGAVRKSYAYGPGVDNILSMTTCGATTNTYYYLKDHLGSVLAVADETGAVVESYSYDAWGRVSVYGPTGEPIAASAIGNRILFQGREYSSASGLYFFRARWYDPITGRWLSNDPIGILGGVNQYTALGNNPVNIVDSFGFCPENSEPWTITVYGDHRSDSRRKIIRKRSVGSDYNPGHTWVEVRSPNGDVFNRGNYPPNLGGYQDDTGREADFEHSFEDVSPIQGQAARDSMQPSPFDPLNNNCVDSVCTVLDAAGIVHPDFGWPSDPNQVEDWVDTLNVESK